MRISESQTAPANYSRLQLPFYRCPNTKVPPLQRMGPFCNETLLPQGRHKGIRKVQAGGDLADNTAVWCTLSLGTAITGSFGVPVWRHTIHKVSWRP